MTPFQQAILTDIQWLAIAVVTVLSAARISRLVVADSWPPTVWLRIKWDTLTKDGPWSKLVHCPYCFAPWSAAFIIGWGLVFDWPVAWWILNGWLATAYLAAMVQARDGDGDE